MKPALPDFFSPVISGVNNRKRSLENLLIALAIIIGIMAQALVFITHKLAYESMPLIPELSFILWLAAISPVILTTIIIRLRKEATQRGEHQKNRIEKTILELEAKGLRAQMNPHFIFNCMNSIKSLIQKEEQEKAVIYLTTFSKLIRTIFQNSDKREVSLYDELETCRLYTQLESMRFGNKFSYNFNVDETIDLKSIMVPALIVQPFIENAIWHGIMPKEDGGIVMVTVEKSNNAISCVINDNGIGRAMSMQNKFKGELSTHQSQGVHLTQARLDLDNALNERNAHMEIIDEKDEYCGVSGTTVILTFEEY